MKNFERLSVSFFNIFYNHFLYSSITGKITTWWGSGDKVRIVDIILIFLFSLMMLFFLLKKRKEIFCKERGWLFLAGILIWGFNIISFTLSLFPFFIIATNHVINSIIFFQMTKGMTSFLGEEK